MTKTTAIRKDERAEVVLTENEARCLAALKAQLDAANRQAQHVVAAINGALSMVCNQAELEGAYQPSDDGLRLVPVATPEPGAGS